MTNILKKRGQKIVKKASRFSRRASENSKEHIRKNLINRVSHIHDIRLLIVEWGLLVAVIIILAFVQSAWYTDSYSIPSYKTGGTYVEGALGSVNSLNPLYASTNSEKTLARLLFSSLAENDFTGHIGTSLAESIIPDTSGKNWTVKLRDGLKWSDGEPLTNEDVLFTVDLIQNPKTSTTYSQALSGVSVFENDDKTIVFELPTAYVDFDYVLDFPILPKHILENVEPSLLPESEFSTKPVSSGPFSFNATQVIGTEGETVTYLSANENYYKGRPYLNSFAIHAYLTKDDIISALNSGSITATAELTSKDSEKISSSNIIELKTAINSGAFIFLNTKTPLLSDKNIRSVIKNSVDLESIRSEIDAMSALDYPIIHTQVDEIEWPEASTHDIANARRAVKEIDEEILKTPISIVTVNEGNLVDVANSLASQLNEIGFSAFVTAYDYSQEFISNVVSTRSYDIFIYEIELGSVPELFSYYHSSQSGSSGLNFSNYEDSLADDMILASRETMDEELRNAKYESFIKKWNEDAPSIAVYQSSMSYFYNKNARTFSENVDLIVPVDRFADVIYWATEKTSLNRTP